jgi:hypothetical protein
MRFSQRWLSKVLFWDITLRLPNCFHAGILLGLFFGPEDGGDMFLRNVTGYTVLYPGRHYS